MLRTMLFSLLIVTVVGTTAVRADLLMFDMGFNVNGTVTEYMYDYDLPTEDNVNYAASTISMIDGYVSSTMDYETGLGTVSFRYDAPGAYNIGSFFDIEINEGENTFFNETAEVFGTPESGLSWEVDEPGFGSPKTYDEEGNPVLFYTGDIYDNLIYDSFDNSLFTSASFFTDFSEEADLTDDVSVGLGWDFLITEDQYAVLTYTISATEPGSGFFITQTDLLEDADGNVVPGDKIYFSTTLDIRGGTQSVPEPGATSLMIVGVLFTAILGVKRRLR